MWARFIANCNKMINKFKEIKLMGSPLKGIIKKLHHCETCGENDPKKFYGKMKSMCYKCHGEHLEEYRLQVRDEALAYKGGKCENCGYDKYRGALEFHHKDPTQKDPQGLRKYNRTKLFAELDKCVLLCANCHREEHAKLRIGSVGELA